jgi:hypothetical protein
MGGHGKEERGENGAYEMGGQREKKGQSSKGQK